MRPRSAALTQLAEAQRPHSSSGGLRSQPWQARPAAAQASEQQNFPAAAQASEQQNFSDHQLPHHSCSLARCFCMISVAVERQQHTVTATGVLFWDLGRA